MRPKCYRGNLWRMFELRGIGILSVKSIILPWLRQFITNYRSVFLGDQWRLKSFFFLSRISFLINKSEFYDGLLKNSCVIYCLWSSLAVMLVFGHWNRNESDLHKCNISSSVDYFPSFSLFCIFIISIILVISDFREKTIPCCFLTTQNRVKICSYKIRIRLYFVLI